MSRVSGFRYQTFHTMFCVMGFSCQALDMSLHIPGLGIGSGLWGITSMYSFRFWDLETQQVYVSCMEYWVLGIRYQTSCTRLNILGFAYWALCTGFWVLGFGYRVLPEGLGFRSSGFSVLETGKVPESWTKLSSKFCFLKSWCPGAKILGFGYWVWA